MKFLHVSMVMLCVLLIAGFQHASSATSTEACLNETAAIVRDNPSLASYADSLDKVFDNCTNVTETSVVMCVYNGPTSADSFQDTCTMEAGGVYYEYEWNITCEANRNEYQYQFSNIKECVAVNCTAVDADDQITAVIQGLENDIENGVYHDMEGDEVTCKSDFRPMQDTSKGATPSLYVSATVLGGASISLLLRAFF